MIEVLDEKVINKIAAGEVIERPAAVVKELIENSLDADATEIIVDIENYGKDRVRVTDNGSGMTEDDLLQCYQRHATSKIISIEDLEKIKSLGFRGEALASIAAVSNLSIQTKKRDDMEGNEVSLEDGEMKSMTKVATRDGTIIDVKDLFYNTPARLKFLKTNSTELSHIINIVQKYALINPKIHFTLNHNNNSILDSPKTDSFLNNIVSIFGKEIAQDMVMVNYADEEIKVQGYVGKPSQVRNNKDMQAIFVNKRRVKNDTISEALYEAFHTLLFVNKHPIAVLNITIDSKMIDVNVHPTKEVIKFEDNKKIHDAIFNAIKKTLEKNELTFNAQVEEKQSFFSRILKKPKYEKEDGDQSTLEVKQKEPQTQNIKEENQFNKLPSMRLLGQINKTFFVAETDNGILIIDQHVVQERAFYEKFMKQYMDKEVQVQKLLKPEVVHFTAVEALNLENNLEKVKEMGFDIEPFEGSSFLVRTVPDVFNRIQGKELLMEIANQLEQNQNALDELKEEIITRMSCRASIKAGDSCPVSLMERYLKDLDRAELPYTCPHGRPIFVKLSYEEIEKMFRRKG